MADIPGGSEDKGGAMQGRIVPLSPPPSIVSEEELKYRGFFGCDLGVRIPPKRIGIGRGRGRPRVPTSSSTEPAEDSVPEPGEASIPEPGEASIPKPAEDSAPVPVICSQGIGRGRGRPKVPTSSSTEPAEASIPEPAGTSIPEPAEDSVPEPAEDSVPETTGTSVPEEAAPKPSPFARVPAVSSPEPLSSSSDEAVTSLIGNTSSLYWHLFCLNQEPKKPEPTPAKEDSEDDFPPYDPRDYDEPKKEGGQKPESAGKTEETQAAALPKVGQEGQEPESVGKKEETQATADALPKAGLGRGKGRGRPVTPTPPPTPSPRPQSPIWEDEEEMALAIALSSSLQIEPDYDDREYTMPSQATDFDSSLDTGDQPVPGTSKKDEGARDDQGKASADAVASPKPGLGRGRGRGRGKKQPSPPSTPMPTSSPPSVREPAAETVSSQPGPSQPESQYVPGRHPFYDKGYEIEEPVVARFGRSELLETFAQHDRRFEGPLKVTTGLIPIKEANKILRKGREETRKTKAWRLIPVADIKDEEEDSDDEASDPE